MTCRVKKRIPYLFDVLHLAMGYLFTASLLVLGVVLAVSRSRAQQVNCYSDLGGACSTTSFLTPSHRACCLGEGFWFDEPGVERCTPCEVFGWLVSGQPLDGNLTYLAMEQSGLIAIDVGYIKSLVASSERLTVTDMSITADTSDYTLITTPSITIHTSRPSTVLVSIPNDSVALEGNETFQLTLEASATLDSNELLVDTLTVIIEDSDDVTIRLDEDDYMGSETAGHAIIRVERIDAIATPVTVRVLPMSYTDYLIQGFDPLPPGRVGILAAVEDFNTASIEVEFSPAGDTEVNVMVPIDDDSEIEPEEDFIVVLELVSAVNPNQVVFGREVSVVHIQENEGFCAPDNFDVQVDGPRTITFFWKHPMECEVVMAYHLSCGPNPLGFPKAFNSPAFTEEGVTSIEGGFAPSTDYNCSVFAFGAFGNGPSVSTAFTTMDDTTLFQLQITGIPNCRQWAAFEAKDKLEDIHRELHEQVASLCSCGFYLYHITSGEFQCFSDSTQVAYRARISGTASNTSLEILGLLEEWISSGTASISVQGFRLGLGSSCLPIAIVSFADPECMDEVSSSGDSESDNTLPIIGGAVAAVLVIVVAVVTMILIYLLLRHRRHVVPFVQKRKSNENIETTMSEAYMAGFQPTNQCPTGPGIESEHEYELIALKNPAYGTNFPSTRPHSGNHLSLETDEGTYETIQRDSQ